jgi:hypothetical protein
MLRRIIQFSSFAVFAAVLVLLTQSVSAQNPTPAPLNRPDINHSEANGCTRCHFPPSGSPERGAHMLEAVGVSYDEAKKAFSYTGKGWFASKHAVTGYGSTQNTYCAKCHSPLQAKAESLYRNNKFENTDPIADGKMEGVTCAACHPSHTSAVILGRRLGIYKFGMDKNKPEAYEVVHHGDEDTLCLNCHVTRHNEDNPAFKLMYDVGVRCIDCHMAPYGEVGPNPEIHKMAHDFKVGSNLPYSCGVQGSMISCHPGMTVEGTERFLPMLKEQHKDWGMGKKNKKKNQTLASSADYYSLWLEIEAQVQMEKANR